MIGFRNPSAWLLAGLLGAVGGLYVWLNLEPEIPIPSRAAAPAPARPESVPGGEQTPEYDRLQRVADGQRVAMAQQSGSSAMPTPPTLDELLAADDRPAGQPATPPPEPPPLRTGVSGRAAPPPAPPATDEHYAAAVERQIKELIQFRDRRLGPPTTLVIYQDVQVRQAASVVSTQPGQASAPAVPPAPRDAHGALRPGDILHAVLQTAINSDEPGPVRARVVGTRFKDAILLGNLAPFPPVVGTRPERVLVSFRYLTLPSGAVYDIEAFAIDPDTTRTALASSVDHHYLSRWGALIAASFLEGYGRAVRASNRITTVGIFGNVVSVPKDDIDDEAIAKEALGTVGERLGVAVGQQFNRPNTIHVDSGSAIGVLIVSPAPGPDGTPALDNPAAFGRGEPLAVRPRYIPAGVTPPLRSADPQW